LVVHTDFGAVGDSWQQNVDVPGWTVGSS